MQGSTAVRQLSSWLDIHLIPVNVSLPATALCSIASIGAQLAPHWPKNVLADDPFDQM